MCVNKDSDHKNNILGMARLAAELLIKHDLTMDKLVRHYDASRKVCPEFMSSDDWKLWNGFYDLTSFIFNVLQGGGDILDIEMQIRDNCEKFKASCLIILTTCLFVSIYGKNFNSL